MRSNDDNKMNPLVSIILPTFNCGEFIEETIESVFRQTYDNFEIIVVDDGSTDNTPQIASKYKENLSYIRQENQGLSTARNVGIRLSKGEYLAFLDADDRWHPNKLDWQIECFRKSKHIGMVFTDFRAIDLSGCTIKDRYEHDAFTVFREYRFNLKEIFKESQTIQFSNSGVSSEPHILYFGDAFYDLCKGNFILPTTTLFKKECIQNIGLLFNEELRCATDQYFHLHFSRYYPIAYLDAVTADYRVGRQSSLSRNRNIPQLVLNTVRTIHDLFHADKELKSGNKDLYNLVVGKHYSVLAHYFLTELDRNNARKYALASLQYKPNLLRPMAVFLLSFAPIWILNLMKKAKHQVHL